MQETVFAFPLDEIKILVCRGPRDEAVTSKMNILTFLASWLDGKKMFVSILDGKARIVEPVMANRSQDIMCSSLSRFLNSTSTF